MAKKKIYFCIKNMLFVVNLLIITSSYVKERLQMFARWNVYSNHSRQLYSPWNYFYLFTLKWWLLRVVLQSHQNQHSKGVCLLIVPYSVITYNLNKISNFITKQMTRQWPVFSTILLLVLLFYLFAYYTFLKYADIIFQRVVPRD